MPSHKQQPVRQIVITGGPSTGKTTLLNQLRDAYPELYYVSEAATEVINGGWPLPTEEKPWTQEWQNGLQMAVGKKQLELEAEAQKTAQLNGRALIIQDRGLLDLASYLADGDTFKRYAAGITPKQALSRYQAVIYLDWIESKAYEIDSNEARYEDEERAEMLSRKVLACWQNHPNLIRLSSSENRVDDVAKVIEEVLGQKSN